MALSVWNALKSTSRILCHLPAACTASVEKSISSSLRSTGWLVPRLYCSSSSSSSPPYDPYPQFQETSDVYKLRKRVRYGYHYKNYAGGVLPRPKGELEDEPIRNPKINPRKRDQWTEKKALFGQNDYIDILGDGSIHPYMLMGGPVWLRGFRGNELQRNLRRIRFEGRMLEELYPTKLHELRKRCFFLYKRYNRRRHARFWSGHAPGSRSRIKNIKDTELKSLAGRER